MNENILKISDGQSNKEIRISWEDVKSAASILRAMNHPLRQQMLNLLEENRIMNVTEIYIKLRLEQSVASQHLSILRNAGIVKTERQGKYIMYTLNTEGIEEVSNAVDRLNARWN